VVGQVDEKILDIADLTEAVEREAPAVPGRTRRWFSSTT
jgi:hypothetical protein